MLSRLGKDLTFPGMTGMMIVRDGDANTVDGFDLKLG